MKKRVPKRLKLTCDAARAQMIYSALVARVAYLERHGEINGIGTQGWREELAEAKKMKEELWAFITLTRSS